MTGDQINGLFELGGSLAVLLSVREVINDKGYAGISRWNLLFFFSWGLWNLLYYPMLGQTWSFIGGVCLALANCIYIGCLWWYPHRPKPSTEG